MQQTCDADYWEYMPTILARHGDPANPGQPCGATFDDLERSTICPHVPLPAKRTPEELRGLMDRIVPSGEMRRL